MVEPVLAAAATVLAAVFLVPQIVRLVVQRDAAGVSPTWAAFGVVTNAAWVAYLGANGLWAAAAAPALAVVTYGITLVVLVPLDHRGAWAWSSCLYGTALALVGVHAGWRRWASCWSARR